MESEDSRFSRENQSVQSLYAPAISDMAKEVKTNDEEWFPCLDENGNLCKKKHVVVKDPASMVIMEPKPGKNNWINQYWTTHIIGAASGATVYRAAFFPDFETLITLPYSETFVSIKVFNVKQTTAIEEFKKQFRFSAFLANHPNIMRIKKGFVVDDYLYAVMPYMAGGSLQSMISFRFRDGFSEDCVRVALRETLKALSYIHAMNQIHKFVDARYIFLCPSTPAIKLAHAASLFEQNTNFLGRGPSYTMPYTMWPAPDAGVNCTYKSDIWLVGITALQLAYGMRVANFNNMVAMVKKLRENSPVEEQKLSETFKNLVALCLDPNPSRRPTAAQLLKHSFFSNCQDVGYFSSMVKPTPQQRRKNFAVRSA